MLVISRVTSYLVFESVVVWSISGPFETNNTCILFGLYKLFYCNLHLYPCFHRILSKYWDPPLMRGVEGPLGHELDFQFYRPRHSFPIIDDYKYMQRDRKNTTIDKRILGRSLYNTQPKIPTLHNPDSNLLTFNSSLIFLIPQISQHSQVFIRSYANHLYFLLLYFRLVPRGIRIPPR